MANIQSGSKWFNKSRINVDKDLLFNGVDQVVYTATDNRHNFDSNNFAISLFGELETLSSETFVSFQKTDGSIGSFELRASSTNELAILWKNSGGSSTTTFTYYFDPIKELNFKMHIVVQRNSNDLEIYVNSKKLVQKTGTTVGTSDVFNFSGGTFAMGASDAAGANSLNSHISHVQIFKTELSLDYIRYIYTNGGIIPTGLHEFVYGHYPLQDFCEVDGSVFTIDAIEQYNYAKDLWSIVDFDNTWSLSAGLSIADASMTYDGTQVGLRSGSHNIDNLVSQGAGVINYVDVKFNIVSNTGSFYVHVGGTTPNQYRQLVSGTGLKELTLRVENATPKLVFANAISTDTSHTGDVWTVKEVEVLPGLNTLNAFPVNFSDNEIEFGAGITDFHNKNIASLIGYSNKHVDADYSSSSNYQFYKFDKGSAIFSSSTDWGIVASLKYTGNFGPNFGVGGARNSMLATGRLTTGICLISCYETGTNKVIFDAGVTSYSHDFTTLPDLLRSDALRPLIIIVTNDSSISELSVTLIDGITNEKETKVFDSSGDPSWSSNNDIRVFSGNGDPIISDIVVSNAVISSTIQNEISLYNFENISSKYLHWKFDDKGDTIKVNDVTGNGRDASLYINDTTPVLDTSVNYHRILDVDGELPILQKVLYLNEVDDQYLQSLDDFQIPFRDDGEYTIQLVFNPTYDWPSSAENAFVLSFGSISSILAIQLRDTGLSIAYDDPSSGQKTTLLNFSQGYINQEGLIIFTILIDNSGSSFGGRFKPIGPSESTQLYLDGIFRVTSSSSSAARLRFDLFETNRSSFGRSLSRALSKILYKGYLVSMDVWDRALSDKEILELANNTLMKIPSRSLQENLQFSLDFQNPIYDTSVNDFVFKDLVYGHRFQQKNLGNYEDIQYNLTDMCDLRDPEFTPLATVDIWVDELNQEIVDENNNFILVP